MTIHLEIPLTKYMPLAGAAALHGMDVATYAKTRSQASLPTAATAATAPTAAPEALPSPAPLIQAPPPFAPPVPATAEEEDALLATLGN